MKIIIIADKNDHKLNANAYSQTYYDMFKAVVFEIRERYGYDPLIVYGDCDASELDADVIVFYDLHSSHHVNINGIEKHPAYKIEMMNDPHQRHFEGKYQDGTPVIKLSAQERIQRAERRAVQAIWCPYYIGYYQFLQPHIKMSDIEFYHYPVCPSADRFSNPNLMFRKHAVLANGAVSASGDPSYDFRRWAFGRLNIEHVQHCVANPLTPRGVSYGDLLAQYTGALALCDWYVVPKYFEIPLSGCVSFVQWLPELDQLGFVDGKNCIVVNKANFDSKIKQFLDDDIENYQEIADKGRELVLSRYTSECFANWFLNKLELYIK